MVRVSLAEVERKPYHPVARGGCMGRKKHAKLVVELVGVKEHIGKRVVIYPKILPMPLQLSILFIKCQ